MTAVPATLPSCALLERTFPSSAYKSCSAPILQQRQVAVQNPLQDRWMISGCVGCDANALIPCTAQSYACKITVLFNVNTWM